LHISDSTALNCPQSITAPSPCLKTELILFG